MKSRTHKTKKFDPVFRQEKLKNLMLYIAGECAGNRNFGATALNKILFFSDFYYYGIHGKSITGATYQRLERGPAPKQVMPAQLALISENRAEIIEQPYFGKIQKRLTPRTSADLSLFDAAELDFVKNVIEMFSSKSALETSDFSHQASIGWQIAGDRQEIPYEAVFLNRDQNLTPRDKIKGRLVARRHGRIASKKN